MTMSSIGEIKTSLEPVRWAMTRRFVALVILRVLVHHHQARGRVSHSKAVARTTAFTNPKRRRGGFGPAGGGSRKPHCLFGLVWMIPSVAVVIGEETRNFFVITGIRGNAHQGRS